MKAITSIHFIATNPQNKIPDRSVESPTGMGASATGEMRGCARLKDGLKA